MAEMKNDTSIVCVLHFLLSISMCAYTYCRRSRDSRRLYYYPVFVFQAVGTALPYFLCYAISFVTGIGGMHEIWAVHDGIAKLYIHSDAYIYLFDFSFESFISDHYTFTP